MSMPFMQLYVSDYLGDTQYFSTEQHGAYLLLLMAMWNTPDCSLPCDDVKTARIARLSPSRWAKIGMDIMAKMIEENGFFTHPRLMSEWQKAEEKSEKRSRAGKSGAAVKALKNKKPASAIASAKVKHLPEPELKPDKKESNAASASLLPGLVYPPWWPTASWDGYVEMRKKIRAALTPRAIELLIADLTAWRAEGIDPAGVLDESTKKGWRGVFKPKGGERDPTLTVAFEQTTAEGWIGRLKIFHGMDEDCLPGTWTPKWGPKPTESDCRVPAEAKMQFEIKFKRKRA